MNARSSELEEIRKTIEFYVEGVRDSNLETLKKGFHPEAWMYEYSGGEQNVTPIDGLYDYIQNSPSPAKTGEPYQCSITYIDVFGNAAVAAMVMDSYQGQDYMDYLHLFKEDGRWWIVGKIFSTNPM